MIKALDTYYDGKMFRSRLEARWAVFFDLCGVNYEYEPGGFDLGNGLKYLPDFLLHDVVFNHAGYSRGNDLYVEVKGYMDKLSAEKVKAFSKEYPVLVVTELPKSDDLWSLVDELENSKVINDVAPYNFETVDGDYFGAYPGIDLDGDFNLFGADSTYLDSMDVKPTILAYRKARCKRFDHGDQLIKEMQSF